jgi:hypothetical protein
MSIKKGPKQHLHFFENEYNSQFQLYFVFLFNFSVENLTILKLTVYMVNE